MILAEFGKYDCKALTMHWLGMSIGAGFGLSTPEYKLNYEDEFTHKFISLVVHLSGFQLCISFPLWKVEEPRPPRTLDKGD